MAMMVVNPVVEVEVGGNVGCLCGGRKKKMQKKRGKTSQ
jgi:hypothetical protein